MFGVHRAACVEVAVGLLGCGHDHEHAVDIVFKLLVGIGLQQVACALDCLVDIGVVKCKAANLYCVAGVGCVDEVLIATRFLTLAECEGNSHLTACFKALAPEIVGHFHRSEWHGVDGVSVRLLFWRLGRGTCHDCCQQHCC